MREPIVCMEKIETILREKGVNPLFNASELASQLEISRRQLDRTTKKERGCSSAKLIAHYRMSLAQEGLKSREDSIEVIALGCGFVSGSSFSRKFKREFKISPSLFRKQCLKSKPRKGFLKEEFIQKLVYLQKKHVWLKELIKIVINGKEDKLSFVSAKDLSRSVFMDVSTLNHKIKNLFGISTKQLVCKLRLHHAAEMIRTRNKRIKEVALMLGFYDLAHFSNSFQQEFGCSPKKYKGNMFQHAIQELLSTHVETKGIDRNKKG